MGKVVIDSLEITPNTVNVNGEITIEIEMHEEYADVKRYACKYPVRYTGKKE